jgi:hypothetical protein
VQTTYQQDLSVAIAGMIADGDVSDLTSYAASEAIPYGRVVVVDAGGTCSLPKTAGAMPTSGVGSPLGVSVYDSAGNPGGFQIGDMVPVLRRGKVWVEFTGTAAADNAALNVKNSSTIATDRGKLTDVATSVSVGVEISAMPRTVAKQLVGTTLVRVDINLP